MRFSLLCGNTYIGGADMSTKVEEELEMISKSQENVYKLLVRASLYKLSVLFSSDDWVEDTVLKISHGSAHWGFHIGSDVANNMKFLRDLENCFRFDGVHAEIEKVISKGLCAVVVSQKVLSPYILPNEFINFIGSCDVPNKEEIDRVADFIIKNTSDKINEFFYDLADYVIFYRSANYEVKCDIIRAGSVDGACEKFKKKYINYKEGVDFTFLSVKKQGDDYKLQDIEKPKMVYSDSLDRLVIYGFWVDDDGCSEKIHYTWNDDDCVYYSDVEDGEFYSDVPRGAELDLC